MLRVRIAAVGLEFDVDSISDVDWEVPGHYRYLQPKPSLLHVGQQGSTGDEQSPHDEQVKSGEGDPGNVHVNLEHSGNGRYEQDETDNQQGNRPVACFSVGERIIACAAFARIHH